MSTSSSASSGSDASHSGQTEQLQKLVKFQHLYHSYRKDKDQEADSHALYAAKLRSALVQQGQQAEDAARSRPLAAVHSIHVHQPAALASANTSAVRELLADMELKNSALKNVTQGMNKLQSEVHIQQAREDEIRAEYQRQVQQLQEKLADAAEKLGKLETERWEVLEAMSTMAAQQMECERERREAARLKLQLEEAQRDLQRREAMARIPMQVPVMEHLGVDDAAELAGQYAELANTLDHVTVALERRLALASGHDPDRLLLDGGLPKRPDMSLQYIQALQEHLMQANAYIARNAASDISLLEPVPVVRHLRAQAHTLGKLLALMGNDTEADAARIASQAARGTEAAEQLQALVDDNRRLAAELAAQPQIAIELQAQQQLVEMLKHHAVKKKLRMHFEALAGHNKELRTQLAAVHKQLTEEQDQRHVEHSSQAARLDGQAAELSALRQQLAVAQQAAAQLIQQERTMRQAMDAALEHSTALEGKVKAFESFSEEVTQKVVDLELELSEEHAKRMLLELHGQEQLEVEQAEMRAQLAAVVDAYSDELAALNRQVIALQGSRAAGSASASAAALARGAAHAATGAAADTDDEAGSFTLAACTKAPAQAGMRVHASAHTTPRQQQRLAAAMALDAPSLEAASLSAAAQGRAEAWKSAYEEAQQLVRAQQHELEEARRDNMRLQVSAQESASAARMLAAAAIQPPPPLSPAHSPGAAWHEAATAAALAGIKHNQLAIRGVHAAARKQVATPTRSSPSSHSQSVSGSLQVADMAAQEQYLFKQKRGIKAAGCGNHTHADDQHCSSSGAESRRSGHKSKQVDSSSRGRSGPKGTDASAAAHVVQGAVGAASPGAAGIGLEVTNMVVGMQQQLTSLSGQNTMLSQQVFELQRQLATASPTQPMACPPHSGRGHAPSSSSTELTASGISMHANSRQLHHNRTKPHSTAAARGEAEATHGSYRWSEAELHTMAAVAGAGDVGLGMAYLHRKHGLGPHAISRPAKSSLMTEASEESQGSSVPSLLGNDHASASARAKSSVNQHAEPDFSREGSSRGHSRHKQHPGVAKSSTESYSDREVGPSDFLKRKGAACQNLPSPSSRRLAALEALETSRVAQLVLERAAQAGVASKASSSPGSGAQMSSPSGISAGSMSAGGVSATLPESLERVDGAAARMAAELAALRAQHDALKDKYKAQRERQRCLQEALLDMSGDLAGKAGSTRSSTAGASGSEAAPSMPAARQHAAKQLPVRAHDRELGVLLGTDSEDAYSHARSSHGHAPEHSSGRMAHACDAAPLRAGQAAALGNGRVEHSQQLPPTHEASSSQQVHGASQPGVQVSPEPVAPSALLSQLAMHRPMDHASGHAQHYEASEGDESSEQDDSEAPTFVDGVSVSDAPSGCASQQQQLGWSSQQGPLYASSSAAARALGTYTEQLAQSGKHREQSSCATLAPGLHAANDIVHACEQAVYATAQAHTQAQGYALNPAAHSPHSAPLSPPALARPGPLGAALSVEKSAEWIATTPFFPATGHGPEEDAGNAQQEAAEGLSGIAERVNGLAAKHAAVAPVIARLLSREQYTDVPTEDDATTLPDTLSAAGDADTLGSISAYDPSGTCRGPRVPQEVLQHAAQYAGDEGLARPSSAVPSALRAADGRSTADGAAVPEEVMQVVQRYCGGEGEARPSTAAPSVLRHGASPREPPVPVEVFQYAQQYTGEEGAARPSTAAPSMLAGVTSPHGGGPTGLGARQQRELPAPALVVHLAAQWQEGGEGLTRPATAPSSDGLRAMRASQEHVPMSPRANRLTQTVLAPSSPGKPWPSQAAPPSPSPRHAHAAAQQQPPQQQYQVPHQSPLQQYHAPHQTQQQQGYSNSVSSLQPYEPSGSSDGSSQVAELGRLAGPSAQAALSKGGHAHSALEAAYMQARSASGSIGTSSAAASEEQFPLAFKESVQGAGSTALALLAVVHSYQGPDSDAEAEADAAADGMRAHLVVESADAWQREHDGLSDVLVPIDAEQVLQHGEELQGWGLLRSGQQHTQQLNSYLFDEEEDEENQETVDTPFASGCGFGFGANADGLGRPADEEGEAEGYGFAQAVGPFGSASVSQGPSPFGPFGSLQQPLTVEIISPAGAEAALSVYPVFGSAAVHVHDGVDAMNNTAGEDLSFGGAPMMPGPADYAVAVYDDPEFGSDDDEEEGHWGRLRQEQEHASFPQDGSPRPCVPFEEGGTEGGASVVHVPDSLVNLDFGVHVFLPMVEEGNGNTLE